MTEALGQTAHLFDAEKLRRTIVQRLRPGADGYHFDAEGHDFVLVVIELAARLPDDLHAQLALSELVRVQLGLQETAPKAGEQFESLLRGSKAALARLSKLSKKSGEVFSDFTDADTKKVAPQHGAKKTGTSLKDLLPPGSGRLDPRMR